MAISTRDQLLLTARTLFAERGFEGVSLSQIASALGFTKQALLHHFSTKEKLYGEVLGQISHEFAEQLRSARDATADPRARFKHSVHSLLGHTPAEVTRTRLLMRELLDNHRRAETAEKWYLKPFLEDLATMLKAVPAWSDAPDASVRAHVYLILGALNYYAISGPTLKNIYGDQGFRALEQAFPESLWTLVDDLLERSHPPNGEL